MERTHYERVRQSFFNSEKVTEQLVNVLASRKVPCGLWLDRALDVLAKRGYKTIQEGQGFAAAFSFYALKYIARDVAQENGLVYYGDLMRQAKFGAWYMSLIKRIGEAGAHTNTEMTLQMLNHEAMGKRVYQVTPGLAQKLRHTVLRGLHTEDLRLPYPAIYVMIPPQAELQIFNDESGWHRVLGAYIMDMPADRVVKRVDYRYDERQGIALPVEGVQSKNEREWRVMVAGEPHGNDTTDDALVYFSMGLPVGASLDSAIEMQRIEHSSDANIEELFRFLMNVVFYATCEDPGEEVLANPAARKLWEKIVKMPESRKRANLIDKASGLPGGRRTVLGKNIVISRNRPTQTAGSSTPTGRTITVRTLVSGHWRRYAIGKGRVERTWKWIEPFWRGPELGEHNANRHVLK